MVRFPFHLTCIAAAFTLVTAASAAPPVAAPAARSPVTTPDARVSAPSVEQGMLRLAEIMGSLAWLRNVCGANDSRLWRDRMNALLEAESASPERKERLAGAYNGGYRAWRLTYNRCTPSGELAIQRFLKEGEKLSNMLSSRVAR